MRKTLTVLMALAAAGSLAACKPFWAHDDQAAKPPTTADAGPTEPTQTAEAAKPAETASVDKPATPQAPAAK